MNPIITKLEMPENGTSQLQMDFCLEPGKEILLDIPHHEDLIWSVILFITQLGLYQNHDKGSCKTYLKLIKRLDLTFLKKVADEYYGGKPSNYKYTLESWIKFLFLCHLFGQSIDDMLQFLSKSAHVQWLNIIGWKKLPSPSRVSEFKSKFGKENLAIAFCNLRDQVYLLVGANRLIDEQVLTYAQRRIQHNPKSYVGTIGFNLFYHFMDGLGTIAELVACLPEMAKNATYKGRDLVLALVHRVVFEAKNMTQLAGKLANAKDLGQIELAPCRVTLGHGFEKFDADKLKALNERLMKRAHRTCNRFQKLRIGIDSTLLEVRGQHEDAACTLNPHTNCYKMTYKLVVACDLDTKKILYLNLVAGIYADTKYLLEAAQAVTQMIAPTPIDLVMFDKGFYKQSSFNELNQNQTPGSMDAIF